MEVKAPNFYPEVKYLFVNRNDYIKGSNGVLRIVEYIGETDGLYKFSLIETIHPGHKPFLVSGSLELRLRSSGLDNYYITKISPNPNTAIPAAGGKRKNRKIKSKKSKNKKQKTKSKKRKSRNTNYN